MRCVLTIGGSDSSGGAGVQADLKAFFSLGLHGCSVVTCVTAQNTGSVSRIEEMGADVVAAQFDAVFEDFGVAAIKTGMLYSPDIVRAAAERLRGLDCPIVVDPVLRATVGGDLARGDYMEALKRELLPLATVVTPNTEELCALTGIEIESVEDVRKGAEALRAMGCQTVVVTGGHFACAEGMVEDWLFDGECFESVRNRKRDAVVHGTGCVYSALLTGLLSRGLDTRAAMRGAKSRTLRWIDNSAGEGEVAIASPFPMRKLGSEDETILAAVEAAAEVAVDILPKEFVPEVGINVGFARSGATGPEDICSLSGRIVRDGDTASKVGHVDYGASRHIARVILAAMSFDPKHRAAMNVRYIPENLERFKAAGLKAASFSRSDEPGGVSSMSWGTAEAIKNAEEFPDVVYDEGGVGKEAMMRVLGKDPGDILKKVRLALGLSPE